MGAQNVWVEAGREPGHPDGEVGAGGASGELGGRSYGRGCRQGCPGCAISGQGLQTFYAKLPSRKIGPDFKEGSFGDVGCFYFGDTDEWVAEGQP